MTSSRDQAIAFLNGKTALPAPADVLALVDKLKNQGQFDVAEALCERVRRCRPQPFTAEPARLKVWRKLRQRQALCTYKDYNRRRIEACEQALEVLDSDPQDETLATTRDQETLGLAGAIWKRRWEVERQMADLEQAASYYLKGWDCRDPQTDDGYTGINAAFMLDCLAAELDRVSLPGLENRGAAPREHARQIRQQILESYEAKRRTNTASWQWWEVATAAEAALGLNELASAQDWLTLAKTLDPPDWEWESTVRQLAALTEFIPEARTVVENFAGSRAPGLFAGPRGKLGLALSGGGFRAAIFHLGVLAALAEADLLRHIEVLSCVSGGSVTGAALYLRLLALMEEKNDGVSHTDYVTAIQALITEFRAVLTSENIRNSAFAGALALNHPTRRLARLLDQRLFRRIRPRGSLLLNDLLFRPGCFHPRRDNWTRRAKLPELVINATTLNTGHTWQFTARSMGEAPFALDPDIDTEERLRRLNHDQAPQRERTTSLGEAVAASATVPVFFPALARKHLFPDRIVRLVDGGVADNQGTFSLDEQDCTLMIVSDASLPYAPVKRPFFFAMLPPSRISDIMMTAIRRYQYRILKGQRRSGRLRALVFLHLTKGLDSAPVDWINPDWAKSPAMAGDGTTTAYGVPKDIQRALSRLRTDLDRFHPDEFDALACSGYLMARNALSQTPALTANFPSRTWSFTAIAARWAEGAPQRKILLRRLRAGAGRFGRGLSLWWQSLFDTDRT